VDDAIGVVNDALEAMLGHNDSDTKVMDDSLQYRKYFLCSDRIKRARRLIEKQDLWVHDKGACDGHSLLLTARESRNRSRSHRREGK
jgi:hypothetical protein